MFKYACAGGRQIRIPLSKVVILPVYARLAQLGTNMLLSTSDGLFNGVNIDDFE